MSADPVLALLGAAFFALLFGKAIAHKLLAWKLFHQQVEDYRILPRSLVMPAAAGLPMLEALAAMGWMDARTRPAAALLSALLLALYAGAIGWNLRRGRDMIDCGCGAPDGTQVIRWALVGRNLALCAVALGIGGIGGHTGQRPLAWVDWLSINAGALVLMGVYAAFNQMLANLPPQRVLD